MNDRWQKLKSWWTGLAEREQKALMTGGVVVVIAVFYGLVWSPYLSYIETLRKRIASDQKTLSYMQALDQKIEQIQNQPKPKRRALDSVALLTELQKQVEHAGLQQSLQPLKQTSQDVIDMHFQHVEFDKLIQLMMKITQSYQLTITHFSAKKDTSAGVVNADLTIKRG